jgi:hypothetical protein
MASGERAWEDSDARRRLSAEADRLSASQRQVATGLEAMVLGPRSAGAAEWGVEPGTRGAAPDSCGRSGDGVDELVELTAKGHDSWAAARWECST